MKTVLLLLFFTIVGASYAQVLEPVKWSFDSEKIGDNEYKIKFTADIEDGWAIYSQFIDEGGPIPTSFQIEENIDIVLVDHVIEPEDGESAYDEMFDMNLVKHKGKPTFYQIVRTESKEAVLKGFLTFMSCDDSKCLPPADVTFEVAVE